MFDVSGIVGILELLSHPIAVLGGVLGLLAGLLAAACLHWLYPFQNLAVLQLLLLAAGLVSGLIIGHAGDERLKRKRSQ